MVHPAFRACLKNPVLDVRSLDGKVIMKKSKASEHEIASVLPETDLGNLPVVTVGKHGNRDTTDSANRKNKGGMTPAETRELRLLEDENRKLKQLVADLTLNKVLLQEALAKKLSGRKENVHRPRRRRAGSSISTERKAAE
jgi:putative transposase